MRRKFLFLVSAIMLFSCILPGNIWADEYDNDDNNDESYIDDSNHISDISDLRDDVKEIKEVLNQRNETPTSSGVEIISENFLNLQSSVPIYIFKMDCYDGANIETYYIYSNSDDLGVTISNNQAATLGTIFRFFNIYSSGENLSQFPMLFTEWDYKHSNYPFYWRYVETAQTATAALYEWDGTNYEVTAFGHYNWDAGLPLGDPSQFVGYMRNFRITSGGFQWLSGLKTFDRVELTKIADINYMNLDKMMLYIHVIMLFATLYSVMKVKERYN